MNIGYMRSTGAWYETAQHGAMARSRSNRAKRLSRYHAGEGSELLARTVMLVLGVQYPRLPVRSIEDYEGLGVADATDSAGGSSAPTI
jgi:hypothetical protein